MYKIDDFDRLDITLTKGKISSIVDTLTGATLKSFHQRLTQAKVAKLYILKENGKYLYVGTTMQSLATRIRYGLTANGKTGYHGYKWKDKERVELYVWSLTDSTKFKLKASKLNLFFSFAKKLDTGH